MVFALKRSLERFTSVRAVSQKSRETKTLTRFSVKRVCVCMRVPLGQGWEEGKGLCS